MLKKLKSRRGESMLEILVSLLIVVLCVEILQVSVVTSNELSEKMRDRQDFSFCYDDGVLATDKGVEGKVSVKATGSDGFDVTMYKNNGYYYVPLPTT